MLSDSVCEAIKGRMCSCSVLTRLKKDRERSWRRYKEMLQKFSLNKRKLPHEESVGKLKLSTLKGEERKGKLSIAI